MKMTAHLEAGMEYAGFQLTHYGGGTTIANIDPAASDPEFLLSGITGGGVFVAYIGVRAKCGVDLTTDYIVSLDFEYDFTDPFDNTAMNCPPEITVNLATPSASESVSNTHSVAVTLTYANATAGELV